MPRFHVRRLPLAFSATVVPRVAFAPHELNNPVAEPVAVRRRAVAFEEKLLQVLVGQRPGVEPRRHLQDPLATAHRPEQQRALHRAVIVAVTVHVQTRKVSMRCRRRVLGRGSVGPEVEGAADGRHSWRQDGGRGSSEGAQVDLPVPSACWSEEVELRGVRSRKGRKQGSYL